MSRDNVLMVHWHDTGRWLGAYGRRGVASPCVDRLAADGVLFTRAHAAAPLCSPARGALFTGRYPHSNGLVGLAHHGFEYRPGVRTLPHILADSGWHTTLLGMQHETSHPSGLGFEEFDVSNAYCDVVTAKAQDWLRRAPAEPFLLTVGFFETHRPYPPTHYSPAPLEDVEVPPYLPDTPEVRADLAAFYGAINRADAAVGQLLDTLAATGLDRSTWVVFLTDHGAPFPHEKSTLYDGGTAMSLIIRPPARLTVEPRVYDDLFSGVDLLPTLLDVLGVEAPAEVEGLSHAAKLFGPNAGGAPVRDHVFTEKTYHDSFDPVRAIRTKQFSYLESYARRPLLDLPLDIQDSASGRAVAAYANRPRPPRELYDVVADPAELDNLLAGDPTNRAEAIADSLAVRLHQWREATADVIPSESVGPRLHVERIETYVEVLGIRPTSRSPIASERGITETRSQ